jgi:excisionase family DNA binding protein
MASTASPGRQRKLSVAEAADYHGCSERTIRRAIAAGRLRAYRVGVRMIRIDPRDLDRMARRIPAARVAGGGDAA